MELEWRDIQDFPDYQISNTGLVKSFKVTKNGRLVNGGEMTSGYRYVRLTKNGKVFNRSIHRLLAIAFIDNPNNYEDVNHINGNKLDNNVKNLEWCTRSDNCKHSCINKLSKVKLTVNDVKEIKRRLNSGEMGIEIAKDFNVNNRMISNIKLGKSWRYVK